MQVLDEMTNQTSLHTPNQRHLMCSGSKAHEGKPSAVEQAEVIILLLTDRDMHPYNMTPARMSRKARHPTA